jgi:type I restriction enzyme, R subunit
MSSKEAKARIKIDLLLAQSGWRFFDSPDGKANISLEHRTKKGEIRQRQDGERPGTGAGRLY